MTTHFGVHTVHFTFPILILERKMEHKVEEYRERMRRTQEEMLRCMTEVDKDLQVFTQAERRERERNAEELIEEERREKEQAKEREQLASSSKSQKVGLSTIYC